MKKFGTPRGAGPGSAKLNVGLATVGTPLAARGFGGAAFVFGAPGAAGAPLPLRAEPLPPERCDP